VEWKAPTGEAFATEGDKEQAVFASFFEHGFNVPTDDFFGALLYFYKLELVHLFPNSIVLVSSFIHLYEAFLRTPPHFVLWHYFFNMKTTGKHTGVVGVVLFCLRSCLKVEWIDMDLPDNTTWWSSLWFYIADLKSALPKRTAHKPEKLPEWDLELTSHELEDLKELLPLLAILKKEGLMGGSVAMSFYRCLILSIMDQVHPTYEYWGQSDPTSEVNCKVYQEEMTARITHMYTG
jgi:hypothetical protein